MYPKSSYSDFYSNSQTLIPSYLKFLLGAGQWFFALSKDKFLQTILVVTALWGWEVVTDIKCVEVRNVTKHSITHPHTKNSLALNANSAKVQTS